MIAESLKQEVESLCPEERRELMGLMVALQIRDDPEYRQMLTNRIDDEDPANWKTLDDLDSTLTSSDGES